MKIFEWFKRPQVSVYDYHVLKERCAALQNRAQLAEAECLKLKRDLELNRRVGR